MSTSQLSEVMQHLRRAGLLQGAAQFTDAHLLESFIVRRDAAALEALVRRHGPMVWGICRRLLGNHHDAEDAFQATFLVFVRKAASIQDRPNLGNWLFGVARRTALKAKAIRSKWRVRETPMAVTHEPAVADQDRPGDLESVLDQELSRLPAKHRTVLVLCDLEGKTIREASLQLGLPPGTVASRLARARAMLAKRLGRRCCAMSGGGLAAALAEQAASASVPVSVMSSTINAVTLVAAGQAATGFVSLKVAALTEGVIKAMLLNKLKIVSAVLVVMAMGLFEAGRLGYGVAAGRQSQGKHGDAAAPGRNEGGAANSNMAAAQAGAIVEKAIQAQGGEANLAKLKIARVKGTYRRFIDATQGKTAVSWEEITRQPDRMKNVQEAELGGQKTTMTVVLRGDEGWISMNGQTEAMDKEMLASTKEELYVDAVSSLLPLKAKECQLSVLAEVKLNGRPAAGVKVAAKGHQDVLLYFDKQNGLLVKREQRIDDGQGGKVTQECFFSDYMETDKIKLPRKITTFANGEKIAEHLITEVQFLNKLDDREFDKPAPAEEPKKGADNDKPKARDSDEEPRAAIDKDKRAPEKPIDLKWRPAKVAGPPGRYLVLVDPGNHDEFMPAAEAMAALHSADLKRFDPAELDVTLAELRKAPPQFVVFVLPPEKIDIDLTHAILEMATKVDDDPFVDFEFGFITGRDGEAALRFVKQIEQAWKRDFGGEAALFASWEGAFLPRGNDMSAMKALGFSARERLLKAKDAEEKRLKEARQILRDCKGKDALMFMSHGYPDRMDLCFSAKNLREWQVDLSPAILFNCACFNGAPGRWFNPTGEGYEDRGVVARDESVALALLDSGIAGYFAGVGAWHGPLNSQVFYYVADDGMRLGEAANAMYNRLALEYQPERIHFEPTLKQKRDDKDAWVQNQRHNGAAMILYGDPALAPFAKRAKHLLSARADSIDKDRLSVKIEVRPLVDGRPGEDFFVLPINRLYDYYSLRSDPEKSPPQLELYRVVPLSARSKGVPALRVVSAKSGDKDIGAGKLQLAIEDTPAGKLLHVRVPLQVSLFDNVRLMALATKGLTVELEESR